MKVFGACLALMCSVSFLQADQYANDPNTVALYHFNGDFQDSSGNNYHLNEQDPGSSIGFNDSWLGKGLGQSLYFSQPNSGAMVESSALIYPGSGSWTVEAVVYIPESVVGAPSIALHESPSISGHEPFQLTWNNGNAVWRSDDQSNHRTTLTMPMSKGEWHHVAGVYDDSAGTHNLYVDGVLGDWAPGLRPENLQNHTVTVGGNYSSGVGHPKYIDELRVSNIARGPEDFAKVLTSAPQQPPLPGSVAWINADDLHNEGITGSGVKIGQLEEALPWVNHPVFANTSITGGANSQTDAGKVHATQVASIMVGRDSNATAAGDRFEFTGMAPESSLVAHANTDLTTGAEYLADAGCDVINISAGRQPWADNAPLVGPFDSRGLDKFVDERGIPVIVATGNDGEDGKPSGKQEDIQAPADAYNVVSVGTLICSRYSNHPDGSLPKGPWDTTGTYNIEGPTSGHYETKRAKPDIVAPGVVTVADFSAEGYDDDSGSSLAAPHVTGAVALMTQAARGEDKYFVINGRVDPRVIKSALLTGANKTVTAFGGRDWAAPDPEQPLDYELGAGGLDALEAKQVMLGKSEGNTKRFCAFDRINGGGSTATATIGHIDQGMSLVSTLVWNAHVTSLSVDLADLDLELLRESTLINASRSAVDNVEHIYAPSFANSGNYYLKVRYDGDTNQVFEWFGLSYRVFLQKGHGTISGGSASALTATPDGFSAGGYSTDGMGADAIPL